ncbi:MAG: group II intron maturase-specific domain-containing protein [Verrucomicrobiales bacterium]
MSETGAYFDFLGRFSAAREEILRLVRPKSMQSLPSEQTQAETRRSNGRSIEAVMGPVNPVIKGWFGYYKQAHPTVLSSMDGWVRMRLRFDFTKTAQAQRSGPRSRPSQVKAQPLLRESRALQSGASQEELMSLEERVKC